MVYREVRDGILSGRYTPGYRLVLSSLASEYGVSPVPVREALRRLEAEGLIEFTRNVGAQVSSIDVSSYADSMMTLAYLEGAATSLAARHITSEDLDRAEELNGEMQRVTQSQHFNSTVYAALNAEFHLTLSRPCPNKQILALLEAESERVHLIRREAFKFNPERSQRSVSQHSLILAMIRDGAPTLDIEMAARDHKLASLKDFMQNVSGERAPSFTG